MFLGIFNFFIFVLWIYIWFVLKNYNKVCEIIVFNFNFVKFLGKIEGLKISKKGLV